MVWQFFVPGTQIVTLTKGTSASPVPGGPPLTTRGATLFAVVDAPPPHEVKAIEAAASKGAASQQILSRIVVMFSVERRADVDARRNKRRHPGAPRERVPVPHRPDLQIRPCQNHPVVPVPRVATGKRCEVWTE